jgi:hypothetical protein
MCENCRTQCRIAIVALAENDEDHPLVKMTREMTDSACSDLRRQAAIDGVELPDDMENEIFDSLIAAQIALTAAHMASKTDPYTDEGGMPVGMILGLWAGSCMQRDAEQEFSNIARSLLGMGDN